MKYLALYRKYRPSNFGDMVGQNKIIKVINNAIMENKLSHAYLFSGPRGTGKTTTAKIIAKMVNCSNLIDGNPCNNCENCLNNTSDIIEIDAASNNGVDEIRELRDKINLVPSSGRYKIYIIDEVHMLTIQAFNALLKTLEEPPSHIVFILATTEPNKIPLTISSRCQKFKFLRISEDDIAKRLQYIANEESIEITTDAIYEIAKISDGGLRDAINLLDELSVYKDGKITMDDVDNVNGSISTLDIRNFLSYLINNEVGEVVSFFDELESNDKSVSGFIDQLIELFKDILLYKTCGRLTNIGDKNDVIIDYSENFNENVLFQLINEINDLKNKIVNSSYINILCCVTILKIMKYLNNKDKVVLNKSEENNNESNLNKNSLKNVVDVDETHKNILLINNSELNDNKLEEIDLRNKDIKINNCLAGANKQELISFSSRWITINEYCADDKYRLIAGLLSDVKPVVVSQYEVMFSTKFDSICDRLNKNMILVSDLILKVYGKKYDIVFLLEKEWLGIRADYIEKIKSGYVFKPKTLLFENNDANSEDLKKLISIVGKDKVEIR